MSYLGLRLETQQMLISAVATDSPFNNLDTQWQF